VKKTTRIFTQVILGSLVASVAIQPAVAEDLQLAQVSNGNQQPLVPNPSVTIGETGSLPVGTTAPSTPTKARAVAPPVGDISISNIDAATPIIKLDSDARVSIVLKEAPVREVLELLSRNAGLNLAYTSPPAAKPGEASTEPTVSLNLKNEPVENAFNYVLQITGYEANRVGNTIFAGAKLPDSIRGTVIRTIRLNQVNVEAASGFLTTQGAETQLSREKVTIENVGTAGAANFRTVEVRTPEILNLRATEGSAPLILKGLAISTDSRLNAVTLIGPLRKVEVATAMLTRLDARRRQVALNVKIVDINLSNIDDLKSSFSFGTGNGIVGVDNGAAVYNYGGFNPARANQITSGVTSQPIVTLPSLGSTPFLDNTPSAPFANNGIDVSNVRVGEAPLAVGTPFARAPFSPADNPFQPGLTAFTPAVPGIAATAGTPAVFNQVTGALISAAVPGTAATAGTPAVYTYGLPTALQIPSRFLATLQAQIISGNGKILTDPTLVVQEGQSSKIKLTQEVFGGFEATTSSGTSATTLINRKPIIKNAGLTLDVNVNRIDDNGFVSVGVSPTVSAISGTFPTGDGNITLLQERTLSSGEIRLRDGQTLILSGIIQESDRTTVSKVPILGDIPILGALFRSTNKSNQRQEVIVLLTPQILNDGVNQVNYTPGNDARLLIQPK
jgi:type IV pilus assembly protein PilQ